MLGPSIYSTDNLECLFKHGVAQDHHVVFERHVRGEKAGPRNQETQAGRVGCVPGFLLPDLPFKMEQAREGSQW